MCVKRHYCLKYVSQICKYTEANMSDLISKFQGNKNRE